MQEKVKITYFKPVEQGVHPLENGYCFATEIDPRKDCGLILYKNGEEVLRVPFSGEGRRGHLAGICAEINAPETFDAYNYYCDDKEYTDPYARAVLGMQSFGVPKKKTMGALSSHEFDWEGDELLNTPFEDTILYGLNVRAFTMHKSSGVKNKGTFEGIVEKIPYLKKLGITAIELMPAYEYDECMTPVPGEAKEAVRINCWGYQKGYYYAPKAAYSKGDPELSFKTMVRELHKNGIEVWMQFYFPPDAQEGAIPDIIRHWVVEYHIDGARLMGFGLPLSALGKDPLLKDTKLRSEYWPVDDIYPSAAPEKRNLAYHSDSFHNEIRRFLKGDEGLISQVLYHQKNNPQGQAIIHELADYDGFSLYDSVSYDAKHNETNGEGNRDGSENNYSWNCGTEGATKKRSVLMLRKQQIKNALTLLLLSQGVPYLFSGDEFANTRFGNNNAYCQDNEIGYVKWNTNRFSEEILEFTKMLIALRKKYGIFHMPAELKVMDTKSCGYPDLSYHGAEPWKPDFSYISRMVGIMLCGLYAAPKEPSFYLALNMHWQTHELALPKLPKSTRWIEVFHTSSEAPLAGEEKITIAGRSAILYVSETKESSQK